MTPFHDAIRQVLGTAPDATPPGKLVRFATSDRRGDMSGWARLFDDGEGGAFGCWREGISETWQSRQPLTESDRKAFAEKVKAARELADQERAKEQAACRERSAAIWEAAAPADQAHPYLEKKGVKPHLARQTDGMLIIPVRGADGTLHGLQFIDGDGSKRFGPGTSKKGHFGPLGKPQGKTLLICEGFATGATIHEATSQAVAVAFDAGNLRPVADALRAKYPDWTLIIAADDDHGTEGNPGITKATEAAQAVGGLLAVPDFAGVERGPKDSDFNDLARLAGLEAVKACIEAAAEPMLTPSPTQESGSQGKCGGHGWSDPLPLPDGLAPVKPFDFELMPDTLRPWAVDICERIQCPGDFVAVGVMVGLGAVIGRKIGIRPQARTDWTVTANQWGKIVGRPGILKSPSLEAALSPLKRLAARANESFADDLAGYEVATRAAKLKAEANEKEARKRLASNPDADLLALLAVPDVAVPVMKRYMANDSTPAALGELLRHNPNGLLVFRDEIVSLLRSLDREDQAEGRGFYLTGWNGDSGYTFDRIGRGMNLHIEAVCLSLLGGTQPGRLAEYVRQAVKGGAADDGLIQRFGLMVWPDTGGEWRDVDRWPDTDAKRTANALFDRLDKLNPAEIGAEQDADQDGRADGIPYLRFDGAALELFIEWRTDLETRLRSGDLHPALESHLAKYRKLIPGLSLICHLADGGTGPVTESATLRALAWGEYLESHAKRVYGSGTQPDTETAKAILARIRKGDLKSVFSSRDVWRNGWAKLADREQVAAGLRLLVDYEWLIEDRIETGGRPATIYHVNPRGLK